MNIYKNYDNAFRDSITAVAKWVETIHGQGSLQQSVARLMQLFNSDAAIMLRFLEGTYLPRQLVVVDPEADKMFSRGHRSFARDIFAEYLHVLKPGAIVWASEVLEDGSLSSVEKSRVQMNLSNHRISDIALLRLGLEGHRSDYLELHFSGDVPEYNKGLLFSLAKTLSTTWSDRLPGTADEAYAQTHMMPTRIESKPAVSILDPSNPLKLTRCEYRVCMLIKEGLLAKSIAESLNVKLSTVRSHLRSIYVKTGTACQVELLHKLTSDGAGGSESRAHVA